MKQVLCLCVIILVSMAGCAPQYPEDLYPKTQEFRDWQNLEDFLNELEREQQIRMINFYGWELHAVQDDHKGQK